MTTLLLSAAAALALSAVGVAWVRRYAVARMVLLDIPNARSSHRLPVPRGGGAGLVLALALVYGVVEGLTRGAAAAPLLPILGILLVAAIGWWDDLHDASVGGRLVGQAAASLTLVPLVLHLAPDSPALRTVWVLFWMFLSVSVVNIVNFMDGIDGLVGSQALIMGVHLALLAGLGGTAALFGLVLAGACLGFLLLNWPPAKIFLGDVGSGALGLSIVVGGALVMAQQRVGIVTSFLPLYPLFLDAFLTLVRRARRGERLTEAHRSHLYQRLANSGWGHARVSGMYAAAAAVGAVLAMARAWPRWDVAVAVYALLVAGGWMWLDRNGAHTRRTDDT